MQELIRTDYLLQAHVLIYSRYASLHAVPLIDRLLMNVQLPRYTNEHVLREKLLQAVNSNAGFDLS